MNPLFLIPAIGVPLAAVGLVVAVKKKAAAGVAPGKATAIPGGTGTVVVPTSIGPGQTVPDVAVSQLPPAVQQALSGPGAPPNQAFVNAVAIQLAQGVPLATVVATTMKATDGAVFDPTATNLIPGLKAGDIIATDRVTFRPDAAGMQVSSVPQGSSIIRANASSDDQAVSGTFIDPRVPDQTTVFTIPLSSVTGIGPAQP